MINNPEIVNKNYAYKADNAYEEFIDMPICERQPDWSASTWYFAPISQEDLEDNIEEFRQM